LNDPLTVTPFRFRSGKKKRLAAIARESDGRKTPLSSISCAAVGAREGCSLLSTGRANYYLRIKLLIFLN
jgi:hypothetical protein